MIHFECPNNLAYVLVGWNYGTPLDISIACIRNQGFASVLQVVLDTPMTAIGVELSEILGTGLAFKNQGHVSMRWWSRHSKRNLQLCWRRLWNEVMKIDHLGGVFFLLSLEDVLMNWTRKRASTARRVADRLEKADRPRLLLLQGLLDQLKTCCITWLKYSKTQWNTFI